MTNLVKTYSVKARASFGEPASNTDYQRRRTGLLPWCGSYHDEPTKDCSSPEKLCRLMEFLPIGDITLEKCCFIWSLPRFLSLILVFWIYHILLVFIHIHRHIHIYVLSKIEENISFLHNTYIKHGFKQDFQILNSGLVPQIVPQQLLLQKFILKNLISDSMNSTVIITI